MIQPNSVLQDRYRILHQIGGGGMGMVYLAEDNRLAGRRCAVKEMSPQKLAPEDRGWATNAFRQEAQMLARLNHPGLTAVTDFFAEDGDWYLVMEYVEGQTLEAVLAAAPGGRLSTGEALQTVRQLCEVLKYLHGQNPPVIFRDLKPSNVMVTPQGQIKLIDFGIARFFKSAQSQDTVTLGTPGYAAPEQWGRAGQSDARSDIYGLGVLLLRLITGYDPVPNPFPLPKPKTILPTLSDKVEYLILRATQMEPDARYQSVAEFQADMDMPSEQLQPQERTRLLTNRSPLSPPPVASAGYTAPPYPAYPPITAAPPRSNRALWIVGGVVVLVAIVSCIALLLVVPAIFPPRTTQTPQIADNSTTPPPALTTAAPETPPPGETPEIGPPPEGEYVLYVLRAGDTLAAIALQYGVELDDLLAANPLVDPDQITIGQTIYIPLSTPEAQPSVEAQSVTVDTDRLGQSVQDRDISLTSIGYDGGRAVVVVGSIQGDQSGTRDLVNSLANYFRSNPGQVPAGVMFHFVPSLNPDGNVANTRRNANNVDLNRNWDTSDWTANPEQPGGVVNGAGGDWPFSEPETAALRDFILHNQNVGNDPRVILYHSSTRRSVGEVYPGGDSAIDLASQYTALTGYDIEMSWAEYTTSGELVTWCEEQGFLALDVVVPASQNASTLVSGSRTLLDIAAEALIAVANYR